MKTLTIKIELENAVFENSLDAENEVARILKLCANHIDIQGLTYKKLYDINGNKIGSLSTNFYNKNK